MEVRLSLTSVGLLFVEDKIMRKNIFYYFGLLGLFFVALFGVTRADVRADTGTPINYLLNKPVTFSGVEGDKVGDDWKYPQFVGEKAVDGDPNTRWSAAKEDDQWLVVDLGSVETLQKITLDIFSEGPDYEILLSTDGQNFNSVYHNTNGEHIGKPNQVSAIFAPTPARYVKYQQHKMFKNTDNGQYYGTSINEIAAYKEITFTSAKEALDSLNGKLPTIPTKSGEKIKLPSVNDKNYRIELYGTDNKAVIASDGTYHQPLVDMPVNILYKVINTNDSTDFATSEKDIQLVVKGQFKPAGNPKPITVPGIREWVGDQGWFRLTSQSQIVLSSAALQADGQKLQEMYRTILGQELAIRVGQPHKGDIYLVQSSSDDILALGEEGASIIAKDYITINSSTDKGLVYGGTTVLQVLAGNNKQFPAGLAHDYPKYAVRSIYLDIARKIINKDFIQEFAIYMSYYKLNELGLHLNDDRGELFKLGDTAAAKELSSFRIKSNRYPELGLQSYQMSIPEFIDLQNVAASYDVSIVPEIDGPAHSAAFSLLPEMKDNMLNSKYMKIADSSGNMWPSTYNFLDGLYGEMLNGGPGVAPFRGKSFSFGTDEYETKAPYSDALMDYINHFTKFGQDRGYQPRAWANTYGRTGFQPQTKKFNSDVTLYLWAPYAADVKKNFENGNPMINATGSYLYIVPGGNAGYHDRLDVKSLYNDWEVNNFTNNRYSGSGSAIMPVAHPQTMGASVTMWNDDGFLRDGISNLDVFDRLKSAVPIIAEKTWFGEKQATDTYDSFANRTKIVEQHALSNPGKRVSSNGGAVLTTPAGQLTDVSGNKRKLAISPDVSVTDVNNAFRSSVVTTLNGSTKGAITTPVQMMGYPYTVSINLKQTGVNAPDASLFNGPDGSFNFNQKDDSGKETGKLGYVREGYTYTFDYSLPKDKWVHLTIVGTSDDTKLYVDGRLIGSGKRTSFSSFKKIDHSNTMGLPLAEIGKGFSGEISGLRIQDEASDQVPQPANDAIVRLVDEDTNKTIKSIKVGVDKGQSYQFMPVYEGYSVDQSRLPSNAKGVVGDEPIILTYYAKKVSKRELNQQISRAERQDIKKYESDSWSKMQNALAKAKTVQANANASQSEVDRVTEELKKAIDSLTKKSEPSENGSSNSVNSDKQKSGSEDSQKIDQNNSSENMSAKGQNDKKSSNRPGIPPTGETRNVTLTILGVILIVFVALWILNQRKKSHH